MTREEIIAAAGQFTREAPANYVSGEIALRPDCAGLRMFEAPIFAFGAPEDPLYQAYKDAGAIGEHFLTPREWLPGAKTVISFFLPYTERIKKANAADFRWPADEWLHGRGEGQGFVVELLAFLERFLSKTGKKSLAPAIDARFQDFPRVRFTSNWSERHVAFACGLGTFGLSRGIITEKGMCGRLGSVLTELELPKDRRPYKETYEYCTMCGACVGHCPARAISPEEGKKHPPCAAFLDRVTERHAPRHGCGKCQVGVPCESGIPQGVQPKRSVSASTSSFME